MITGKIQVKLFVRLRYFIHPGNQETVQGLKFLIFKRNPETLFQFLQRCHAFDQILVISFFFDMLTDLVIFIQNIPHDLLQNIFHGHQSVRLSVLIHHNHHLLFSGLHLPEQFVNVLGPVDKDRLAHQPFQFFQRPFQISRLRVKTHGILQMQDTDNVVDILLIDRITAVFALYHKIQGFFQRHFRVYGHHIGSVGHDILGFLVAKFKNIGDHLCFTGLNHPLLMPLIYHIDDFFLGHVRIARIAVNPQQAQDSLCGHNYQLCKRRKKLCYHKYRCDA